MWKVCFLSNTTLKKNIGNGQKPISSSCIATEPHNFKILPICQLEFLGLVIHCFFFFVFFCLFFLFCFVLRFLRNYVSIIVNVVSNNVLMCYLLWIFVSIRRLLQLIVCTGVSTPPHSTQAVVFSVSKETKFKVDTTSIILSYLCQFRNVVNKELFRYLLIYSILNHAS